MADLRFITLAADPALVPGVYNGCDQWCDYCRLTERCLAFKCRRRADVCGHVDHDIAEAMRASMIFLKDCHEAEGLKPPEDLMRLLHADAPERVTYEPVDDGLEKMGKHYALTAAAYLGTCDEDLGDIPKRPGGPTPFDVFFYHHVFIALKIYRGIVSAAEAARTGSSAARRDADVSAKVALLGIDRSDEALQVMALDDIDPRIEHLRRQLARLRRAVEGRFPAARTVARAGFDDGTAAAPRFGG